VQEHYRRQYATHAQLGSFRRRVADAEATLRHFLDICDAPYAAFSGGKDSSACLALLARIGRTDIPVLTQADDLDWPEKRAHCHRVVAGLGFHDYTYAEAPASALAQLAVMDGVTTARIREREVFWAVVRAFIGARTRTGVILGLRAAESRRRRFVRRRYGRCYRTRGDGLWRCLPVADWSGVDVFALLVAEGVPWFHLYDRDRYQPPHEHRLAWLLNPAFLHRGVAAELRRDYPAHFARLARLNAALRRFA